MGVTNWEDNFIREFANRVEIAKKDQSHLGEAIRKFIRIDDSDQAISYHERVSHFHLKDIPASWTLCYEEQYFEFFFDNEKGDFVLKGEWPKVVVKVDKYDLDMRFIIKHVQGFGLGIGYDIHEIFSCIVLRQVFTNGEYPGFTLVRDITYYPDRSEYCLCALKETSEFKTDGTQFKEVLDELKPEFSLPSKAVVGLKRLNPRLYKQLVRNNPGIQQEFTEEVEYEPFDYIENYNLLDFNKYSKIDSEEVKKVNDAYDALMELADQLE